MDRPRERVARLGAAALADPEVLALILGTGQAGEDVGSLSIRILKDAGGLWALARMSVAELERIPGIGPAKAARLAAAFEAGSRGLMSPDIATAPLSSSEMVFLRYGRRLMSSPIERFFVISVDAKNRVRAEREIARAAIPSRVRRTSSSPTDWSRRGLCSTSASSITSSSGAEDTPASATLAFGQVPL